MYYDTDTDTDTDTEYSSNTKEYNKEIFSLVEEFTNIKEKVYNETQAVIKKMGRESYLDSQYKTIEKLIRA
jgi:hypothetical protein